MHRLVAALVALALLLTPALAQQRPRYILAISWEPAFCENNASRDECTSQTEDRFDAQHFVLHGLWPGDGYCNVLRDVQAIDKSGKWDQLPALDMSADTRKKLEQNMPGTMSYLDRHEWIRHGTCYGEQPDPYFTDALDMVDAVNASAVRDLFAKNIGKELTQEKIRAAFDKSFGKGAGERVRVSCNRDADRRVIVELTIGLAGDITGPADFGPLALAARSTDGGCKAGIVDAVGLQ